MMEKLVNDIKHGKKKMEMQITN